MPSIRLLICLAAAAVIASVIAVGCWICRRITRIRHQMHIDVYGLDQRVRGLELATGADQPPDPGSGPRQRRRRHLRALPVAALAALPAAGRWASEHARTGARTAGRWIHDHSRAVAATAAATTIAAGGVGGYAALAPHDDQGVHDSHAVHDVPPERSTAPSLQPSAAAPVPSLTDHATPPITPRTTPPAMRPGPRRPPLPSQARGKGHAGHPLGNGHATPPGNGASHLPTSRPGQPTPTPSGSSCQTLRVVGLCVVH